MHIKIAAVVRVLLNGGVERVNKVENSGKLDLIDRATVSTAAMRLHQSCNFTGSVTRHAAAATSRALLILVASAMLVRLWDQNVLNSIRFDIAGIIED